MSSATSSLGDLNVAVADDAPVQLQHAEPRGVQLFVANPRDDLLGVNRPLVPKNDAKELGNLVGIVLAELSERDTREASISIFSGSR
jgi:hypothetical protein